MISWPDIDVVFLDMDGTLLDLSFDNHFWLEYVPSRYAAANLLDLETAKTEIFPRYQQVEGTMQWYCLDYWSRELGLDIAALKEEVSHLIAVQPHVPEFLAALKTARKRVVLVTNAHNKSLDLKMNRTGLRNRFDAVVSAHSLGLPKEAVKFWDKLQSIEPFDRSRTLLIDDNLFVLRAAQAYGVRHLLAVHQPDSGLPPRPAVGFRPLGSFTEIMPFPGE